MDSFPIMLNVRGRRCVIVGGGSVAIRRAKSLLEAGAKVVVIAPDVAQRLRRLAGESDDLEVRCRGYQDGDLAGARVVVAATDDLAVNEAAAAEARRRGVWCNRADDPGQSDFAVPAHARRGPITLAVDTGGASPAAAAALRDQLVQALGPDWPALLEVAAEYRPRIQRKFSDPQQRRDRLRRLTDADALAMVKSQGVEALRAHYQTLLQNDEAT